ncbi:ATP-binding protein [Alteromonas sp. C1M14]|uniref:ATP-binding protein n=1 Tax=Alteromonas sp. C1M14 TaxID=2841567 RepID=UPI001C08E536|nr:ATP-binding protein [Alteromonas sp. C1M14]MBU2976812.1 ATPase [Alteromonas sp. C1M14]
MKLSQKLFFILVGSTCLILTLSLLLARWSFEQGFSEFILNQESDRLATLRTFLIREYEANNNRWDGIDPNAFVTDQAPWVNGPPRPPRGGPPNVQPFRDPSLETGPPTALLTPDGQYITGNRNDGLSDGSMHRFDMPLVLDGESIGILRSWRPKEPDTVVAQSFSRQQLWSIIIIGLICLATVILFAIIVIPRMLAPFRDLMRAVNELEQGHYDLSPTTDRKDEFGHLMRKVSSLAQVLKTNRETKNRWFADISHELRTPLTILSGEIELIKAKIRPFNEEQVLSIEQEVMRLRRLVDDLYQLSLNDIGGLRYHFEQVNLSDILASQLECVDYSAKDKNITIDASYPARCELKGDGQRLRQLILNLLVNGITYTNNGGIIRVSIAFTNDHITVIIEDSPPGVEEKHIHALFEPLYRTDSSRTRKTDGAGLGLTICRSIVEAHNGTITALPSSLGGLKIEVNFPCSLRSHDTR